MTAARHFLDDAILQLRKLKAQADKAIAQADDRQFFQTLDPEANSIALIMKHMAGNMRSRWTDFLTSDGEKPDRERDDEFVVLGGDTRASVTAAWEDGWKLVFDAISPLTEDQVLATVRVRGEAHTVLEAIDRQLTHYAAHVGQIVLLAKHYAGANWKTLSIPRGKSKEFDVAKSGGAYGLTAPSPAPAAAGAGVPPGGTPSAEAAPTAAARQDEKAAWEHFLQFLRTAPALPGPQEMLQAYGKTLAAEGFAQADIQRRIGALLGSMRHRSDAWSLMFDRIYASGAPNVIEQANGLLMAAVEGRPTGRALEVAVGHGRNAVALAVRGWDVTGIDVSEEGLAIARANAERAGVRLALRRETDETFDFGESAWDLIAVIYGPVSITEPAYVKRLDRALKPGGLVVVDSFASETGSPRRRPVDIDPRELRHAFDAFRIVRFEDTDGVSEWDPQPTRLVRLIAQKM